MSTKPEQEPESSGEWTADTVQRLEFDNPDRRYDAIADAHNALLAALVDALKGWKGYAWKDDKYIDEIQEYFDAALAQWKEGK